MLRWIRARAQRRRAPEVVHVHVGGDVLPLAELEQWLAGALADLRKQGRL
ncbi:hypothetical protein [Actinomadura sp. CNU-125]|nr:hypothetical protein [Actinomadura sp. CNU-125]